MLLIQILKSGSSGCNLKTYVMTPWANCIAILPPTYFCSKKKERKKRMRKRGKKEGTPTYWLSVLFPRQLEFYSESTRAYTSVCSLPFWKFKIFRSNIEIFDTFRIYLCEEWEARIKFIRPQTDIQFPQNHFFKISSLLLCVLLASSS